MSGDARGFEKLRDASKVVVGTFGVMNSFIGVFKSKKGVKVIYTAV